jgi:hypothetical protein
MENFWQTCSAQLELELTPQQFSAWIKPLTVLDFEDGTEPFQAGLGQDPVRLAHHGACVAIPGNTDRSAVRPRPAQ